MLELPEDVQNAAAMAVRRVAWRMGDLARRREREVLRDTADIHAWGAAREPSVEELAETRLLLCQVIEFAGENLSAAQYDAFRAFCQSGGDLGGAVRMLAAETGRSERTIRTHISRALRRIRREMEGEICD